VSNEVKCISFLALFLFRFVWFRSLLCPELVLANALTHLKQRMETGREVIVMKCACFYEINTTGTSGDINTGIYMYIYIAII
jgi:hypothetical protein